MDRSIYIYTVLLIYAGLPTPPWYWQEASRKKKKRRGANLNLIFVKTSIHWDLSGKIRRRRTVCPYFCYLVDSAVSFVSICNWVSWHEILCLCLVVKAGKYVCQKLFSHGEMEPAPNMYKVIFDSLFEIFHKTHRSNNWNIFLAENMPGLPQDVHKNKNASTSRQDASEEQVRSFADSIIISYEDRAIKWGTRYKSATTVLLKLAGKPSTTNSLYLFLHSLTTPS